MDGSIIGIETPNKRHPRKGVVTESFQMSSGGAPGVIPSHCSKHSSRIRLLKQTLHVFLPLHICTRITGTLGDHHPPLRAVLGCHMRRASPQDPSLRSVLSSQS